MKQPNPMRSPKKNCLPSPPLEDVKAEEQEYIKCDVCITFPTLSEHNHPYRVRGMIINMCPCCKRVNLNHEET